MNIWKSLLGGKIFPTWIMQEYRYIEWMLWKFVWWKGIKSLDHLTYFLDEIEL